MNITTDQIETSVTVSPTAVEVIVRPSSKSSERNPRRPKLYVIAPNPEGSRHGQEG